MAVGGLFMLHLLLLLGCVNSKLLAGVVLPHGGIALDPSHFNTTNATKLRQAWDVHNACVQVGSYVNSLKPDLILLSTPHGVADETNFVFYLNSAGSGPADTDNCQCPPCCFNASVPLDVNTTNLLLNSLKSPDGNVSGVVGFGDAVPFPLHWGEVIPLHFIMSPTKDSNFKVVVLSQPNRRYTESVTMIPELLATGSSLFNLLDSSHLRVVVVVSADMAHTHEASGPYGYSNASQPFDDAVSTWASMLDSSALLVKAASLVDQALSCGYTGLVMLHGLMSSNGLKLWKPRLLINEHPSYYGMMVATFTKEN